MCEAYLLYPRKKESLYTEAMGKGRWGKGVRHRDRESETAYACEDQKSIASIFLSGSLA